MRLGDIKVGNHVILVDAAGIFTLESNISYAIKEIEIREYHKDIYFIRVKGDEEFYNHKRFKLDVKFQRKEKLKKLNEYTKFKTR